MEKVEKVFIFLSEGDNGKEGIINISLNGKAVPLIAFEEERMKMFLPLAKNFQKVSGKPFRVAHFNYVGEIEFE